MKAVVYSKYGSPRVFRMQEIEKPVTGENEILIRVRSTSVTPGDCVIRRGNPYAARLISGLSKPKNPILGHEFSGEVVETGKNITRYKIGDRVFGSLGLKSGSYAEYLLVNEDHNIQLIPEGTGFNEAAVIPMGAMTALFFLRKGNITADQSVLINGASGSIGTYAIQLAKYYGAKVTAVCSSRNAEMVRQLGADEVIDYTRQEVFGENRQYHLIFDTVGKLSFNQCKNNLALEGCFVSTAVKASLLIQMAQTNLGKKKRMYVGILKERQEDLAFIRDLLKEGKLRAVIDRTYPLEEISKAHEYVETGHKKGNLVITIN